MHYLIPAIYLVLFTLIVYWLPVFRISGKNRLLIPLLFLLKCFAGGYYTAYYINDNEGSDIESYYIDGQVIYNTLEDSPGEYIRLALGPNNVANPPKQIQPEIEAMGFWHDTSDYMVVRFNALIRLISFGNIYVHALFMSFFSFLGFMLIFRSLARMFPDIGFVNLLIPLFLIPTVVFWSSGIHKEGLLIFSMGLLFYSGIKIQEYPLRILPWLWLIAGGIVTYLVRDFIFLLLLPLILAYIISTKTSLKPVYVFIITLATITLISVFSPVDKWNVLMLIKERQDAFLSLVGGTTNISISAFDPTLWGLIKQIPEALYHGLISPFTISPKGAYHIMLLLDQLLITALLIWGIIKLDSQKFINNRVWLSFFFFSIGLIIIIGLIVPNIGAIDRYRSIALPFLLLPLMANIDFKWLKRFNL